MCWPVQYVIDWLDVSDDECKFEYYDEEAMWKLRIMDLKDFGYEENKDFYTWREWR